LKTRILSADEVNSVARQVGLDKLMDEVISDLYAACLDESTDTRFEIPRRDGFSYNHPATGLIEWMPIHDNGACAVIKVVGYHPGNPATRRLPTVMSSLMRFDTATGHLQVIADGTLATAIRTGAASAIASRALALPDSTSLALIGAGAQAITQLHALSRVFSLEEVLVFDVDESIAESFLARAGRLQLAIPKIEVVDCQKAVRSADILCTVTSVAVGEGPVFEDRGVKPWLHVNAVGSDFPGKTEVPTTLLERSFVCPDFLPQAIVEGECQMLDQARIGPELPAILRDKSRLAELRQSLTVFDSTGYALQDHVILGVFEKHARAMGLGHEVQLECVADPYDPYFGAQLASVLAAESRCSEKDDRAHELRLV
jgi:ornithine cyclodeaminase/alanine dehydrogenase-like protein (mu-crystallin family)